MKGLKYIQWICLMTSLVFSACTLEDFSPNEWAVEPELQVSNNYVVFNSAVGNDTITVKTNYEKFQVTSSSEWCHVKTDVDNGCIYINVDPNTTSEQRIATVSVKIARGNKMLSNDVSVIQFGGIWDTIGGFNVYWRNEIGEGQREALVELLESMQYVEGGTFMMGTGEDEHSVKLSSFYIGKFELTQKQWNAIFSTNNSIYVGANLPIENISWAEALDYVTKLSHLTNLNFSLPTEAQWEYAARGGNKSLGYTYPGSNDYAEVAHYVGTLISEDNPLYTTHTGGTKLPNELGLYDMAGNVAEYCFDWYDSYNNILTDEDPMGAQTGSMKVVRGGYFSGPDSYFKSTYRVWSGSINYIHKCTGFRVVLKP